MSPGSVTERLHFFVAEVSLEARITTGGGDAGEGEGRIVDGKRIMLLCHAEVAWPIEG